MKYSVYYSNNVETNKVAEFETLKEAKDYCAKNTEGCDEVCAEDNCYEHNNNFWYEVYEGIAIPEDISSDIYNSLKNNDK